MFRSAGRGWEFETKLTNRPLDLSTIYFILLPTGSKTVLINQWVMNFKTAKKPLFSDNFLFFPFRFHTIRQQFDREAISFTLGIL